MYKRQALEPLIHGGESTTLYRSGTPTVALACSLALALEKAVSELPARVEHIRALNARLRTGLAQYPKVRINSPDKMCIRDRSVAAACRMESTGCTGSIRGPAQRITARIFSRISGL